MNNKTPKTLADLNHQENVLHLKDNQSVSTEAQNWFFEIYGIIALPKVNKLFTEDERTVYESYVDSGSVDYLYLVK